MPPQLEHPPPPTGLRPQRAASAGCAAAGALPKASRSPDQARRRAASRDRRFPAATPLARIPMFLGTRLRAPRSPAVACGVRPPRNAMPRRRKSHRCARIRIADPHPPSRQGCDDFESGSIRPPLRGHVSSCTRLSGMQARASFATGGATAARRLRSHRVSS